MSYLEQFRREDGVCLQRTDLLSDRAWYRAMDYQVWARAIGFDNTLWCFRSISPRAGDEVCAVQLYRADGDRVYTARDRVLVREAMAAIAPLVGGPLARFTDPSPADLAPRVRQVLRCLLEGDGDKQIAARLGLTRHTVNQYAKTIFRHFGVQSRAELLARWVRRGYGNRFPWVAPDRG